MTKLEIRERLKIQHHGLKIVRKFFDERGFLEILPPPIVENPGMEAHIHPFLVSSFKGNRPLGLLHTSPEFMMKEILSEGEEKIYTLNFSFRDELESPWHRKQFLMLEWYRTQTSYDSIIKDCKELIEIFLHSFKKLGLLLSPIYENGFVFKEMTVQEIFHHFLGIDILQYETKSSLRNLCQNHFRDIPLPHSPEELNKMEWDDFFFLIFLNKIEPQLSTFPCLILKEFPAPLAALSCLKKSNPKVCERFEIYLRGIEVGNCFFELTDFKEQEKRFKIQEELKERAYNYKLPKPERFLKVLKKGLPVSSGIALGFERLLMAISQYDHLFFFDQTEPEIR